MEPAIPVLNPTKSLDRQALWEAHSKRCVYCGDPLILRDLEIDHIIPEYLAEKTDHMSSLEKLFRELGVPQDYDLNSADNLLPAHSHCNRKKGASLRDESWLRHFRGIAGDKVEAVMRRRERLEKQENGDKAVAEVSKHVESGTLTPEYIYDSITQVRPFNPADDKREPGFVRVSQPRVRIECKLPTIGVPGGSALVTFHPVELRGVQVEVDHATLTRELFRGLGGPAVPKLRPFIHKPVAGSQVVLAQFGGTSVQLGNEEVTQLSELLDALAPHYIEAFRSVEQCYRATSARLISPGLYEIARVSLPLWNQIGTFVRKHDLGDGTSEWHIFDAHPWGMLKIIDRTEDSWDYRCFLDAVACRRNLNAWPHGSEEVSVRWENSTNRLGVKREDPTDTRWTVEQAARFLFDRLIPKMKGGSFQWENLRQLVANTDKDLVAERLVHPIGLSLNDLATPEQAEGACTRLQEHFLGEHDQFVSPIVIAPLLRFLTRLLKHHELPSYSVAYISEKLGRPERRLIQAPLDYTRGRLDEVAPLAPDAALVGQEADDVLRAVVEVIRNGTPRKEIRNVWREWVRDLQPVIDDFNRRSYLARLRAEDWED